MQLFLPPPTNLRIFNPQDYGAYGDGVHDDTAALQACINDTMAVSGEMYVPHGRYLISAALAISDAMSLSGAGAYANYGTIANITPYKTYMPSVTPNLRGSIFIQSATATNVINITVAGQCVNLRHIGLAFSTPFINTGHGVYCVPPTVAGQTYADNGINDVKWDSVKVFGHDGNHYAFVMVNPSWCEFSNLKSYGGGHLNLNNNSTIDEYGNSVFTSCYGSMPLGGTAHGIYLQCVAGIAGSPNLVTFIRPQITTYAPNPAIAGTTSVTSAQNMLKCDTNTANCGFITPDFETNAGCGIQFPTSAYQGRSMWTNGGLMTTLPTIAAVSASGAIYQNTTGTAHLWMAEFVMNPTSSAAATVVIRMSANPDMSSSFIAAQISAPANAIAGALQAINLMWNDGFYATFTWTNATLSTIRSVNTL